MKKEYFVGIDFGHGETTVSRVPGYNGEPVSQIPLTTDSKVNKVLSAICRHGENWSLVIGNSDFSNNDLQEGFKGIIHTLSSEDKTAFRNFAKLIFKTILDRDTKLVYNSIEDRNFELGIACPTEWRSCGALGYSNASEEYLDFFRRECLLPVDYCINESDAAFFSKRVINNIAESTFVIDYGSSTIDFTTYVNSKVDKDLCWGVNKGAHRIEEILKAHIINDNVKETLREIVKMREDANISGKLDPAIMLFLRQAKENYYINQSSRNNNDFYVNIIKRDFIPTVKIGDSCIFAAFTPAEYDEIISSYVNEVRTTIIQAKQRLVNQSINPNRVILSGGASSMPFFKNIVSEVFAQSIIDPDLKPECVVSNGIALYGKDMNDALELLLKELKELDYTFIFKSEYANAKSTAISELVQSTVSEIESCGECNGKTIRNEFFKFLKSLNSCNTRYKQLIINTFNAKLSDEVAKGISSAVRKVFKFEIPIDNIQINTDPAIYHYLDECYEPGGAWYNYITNWIKKSSSTLFASIFFDWDNNKDTYETSLIANGVARRLKEHNYYNTDTYEELDCSVNNLKDQVIRLAEDAFHDNQIFETTFRKYI